MTGSKIPAVWAQAQKKIGYKYLKSWSNFQTYHIDNRARRT